MGESTDDEQRGHVCVDWSDWHTVFKPQVHPARRASGDIQWETYGDDLAEVDRIVATCPGRVWTCVDVGEPHVIVNGKHLVNRLAYHVTERACRDDITSVDVVDFDDLILFADRDAVVEYKGLDPSDPDDAEEIAAIVKQCRDTLEFAERHRRDARDLLA